MATSYFAQTFFVLLILFYFLPDWAICSSLVLEVRTSFLHLVYSSAKALDHDFYSTNFLMSSIFQETIPVLSFADYLISLVSLSVFFCVSSKFPQNHCFMFHIFHFLDSLQFIIQFWWLSVSFWRCHAAIHASCVPVLTSAHLMQLLLHIYGVGFIGKESVIQLECRMDISCAFCTGISSR